VDASASSTDQTIALSSLPRFIHVKTGKSLAETLFIYPFKGRMDEFFTIFVDSELRLLLSFISY
jgi:hypothetical protein